MKKIDSNQPDKKCVLFGHEPNCRYSVTQSENEMHSHRFLTDEELDEIFCTQDSPFTKPKSSSPQNYHGDRNTGQSVIYAVTVTYSYKFPDTGSWEYTRKRTKIECDLDNRSYLFLTLDTAKKKKDELVFGYENNAESRLFSIHIDEYEEGADITVRHPKRAWYYDNHGRLVKDLIRIGNAMEFVSGSRIPTTGDIVELPLTPTSIGLGIIASNHDLPHESHHFKILTGCNEDDFHEYEAVEFMPYSGQYGNADFMKEYLMESKQENIS